ncbi:hypothetical protein FQA39_LY19111 [Lamprigera yunnana]|nr:hypothetical protein FQA39_LY19111 [Lamprigera yunnana]
MPDRAEASRCGRSGFAGICASTGGTLHVWQVDNLKEYIIGFNLITSRKTAQLVIHLKDVEEYDVSEISELLEMEENASKGKRLCGLRQKVKEQSLQLISAMKKDQLQDKYGRIFRDIKEENMEWSALMFSAAGRKWQNLKGNTDNYVAEKDVMDEILPKRGRLKREKPRICGQFLGG